MSKQLRRNRKWFALAMIFLLLTGLLPAKPFTTEKAVAETSDLFFSEYIEGSSNNKALEIYNGTGSAVDLSGYTVELYSNGKTDVSYSLDLEGTLDNGDVYIIANAGAVPAILDLADITSTVTYYNGDDALVLKNNGNVIDSIGKVGEDPGSVWGAGDAKTAEQTLVRKSSITSGDKNQSDDFDPATEWDHYSQNDFTYLGTHTVDSTDPEEPVDPGVTAIADARKLDVGTTDVTVKGVITSTRNGKISIQDNTAGLSLYKQTNADVVFKEGDTVKVTGKVTEFNGVKQIQDFTAEIVDASTSVPEPQVLSIDLLGEDNESEIIKINNVTLGTVNTGGSTDLTDENGNKTTIYKVPALSGVAAGDQVDVIAIVSEYKGTYQLHVRTAGDVTPAVVEETPDVNTISEARAAAEGTEVTIEGVVTHNETGTIMYVQDSTGGIKIDTYGKDVSLSSYQKGDKVNIKGVISLFRAEAQVTVDKVENITKINANNPLPQPKTITIEELGDYQGQLVTIQMAKLNATTSTTHSFTIEDTLKKTTTLYHANAKNFTSSAYKVGEYYDITGVAAMFNTPQLKLRDGADMLKQAPPQDAKLPLIYEVKPSKMTTILEKQPVISGKLEETETAIDWASFKLLVDGQDVTAAATVNKEEFTFSYNTPNELALGEHSIFVEISDVSGAKNQYISYFYVAEQKEDSDYNFYFGVPHAHTGFSDGKGTPADAYQMSYDNGLDYIIVTDHSNWLDGDKYVSERKEFEETVGSEWHQTKEMMNAFNAKHEGDFLAMRGFEMTSSHWGHINVFNAQNYVEAKQTVVELGEFYEWLTTQENVVASFNHPNWPSDSYNNLAYVPEVDHLMATLEVGNGAPPYSYARAEEHFFRAMDNGWHVGAVNGQDNHSANWGAPDNLTAVVAEDLTNESFMEAFKARRVYSTEARDAKLRVKANDFWMGSTLDVKDGEELKFDIWVQDETNPIDEIQIISNGGEIIKQVKVGEATEYTWNPTIIDGDGANWYVVKVIHTDSKWTTASAIYTAGGEMDVKLTLLEVNPDPSVPGFETDLTATVSNMGVRSVENLNVKFYSGSVSSENYIGESPIAYIGPGKKGSAKVKWIPEESGQDKIIAVLDEIENVTTVTKLEKIVKVVASNGKKVLIDSFHKNADVPGSMNQFSELLRRYGYTTQLNTQALTAESLAGYDVLVINAPDKNSPFSDAENKAVSDWVKAGGSLMLASKSNFGYDNSNLNPLLSEMGSGIRINNDNVYEPNTSDKFSGGMKWSVYAYTMPTTTSGLNNNMEAIRYFSGASLVNENLGALTNNAETGLEILVAGNSTSYNFNVADGYHTYNPAIGGESDENQTSGPDGENIPLIAKEYVGEGRIIVAGRHFYSDFEIVNDVSNTSFTLTTMDWLSNYDRTQDIATVRENAKEGDIVTVKGVVTAPTNKFFDTVYIQDETGGIALYGPQGKDLPVGTVVIATGGITYFEGELELAYENFDMEILYVGPGTEVETKVVDSKDVTAGTYNGQLVKLVGTIKEINDEDSYMLVTDCYGDAYIHTDGYLPLGVDRFQEGDQISVAGIASSGMAGNRIRVRFAEDLEVNTDVIECPVDETPGDGDGGETPGDGDGEQPGAGDGGETPGDGDGEQPGDGDHGETPGEDNVVVTPEKPKKGAVTVETSIIDELAEGATLTIDLKKVVEYKVAFTAEQIKLLKEKGITIVLSNKDVEVHIPVTNFPTKSVEIDVKRMKDNKEALSAVYDFKVTVDGNEYSVFDKMMTLVFKVDAKKVKKAADVTVLYYNEDKKKWEDIGGKYEDGTVTAYTDHFSTFAAFEVSSDDAVSDIPAPKDGYTLPSTATNTYNLLLIGLLFMAAGTGVVLFRKRKFKVQA
ncbi:CehA/McbA family metallohydrolase [Litchfieldia alkalitelluris]|uniref:CehA/McbA family metallohydrolase n=1 Tax=Litchfieldia alkalitelluris TaxID=304268 RepID=UPI0009969714|nr:CehA/McbA family metallohydrolase [Litchfieldia alkalitelluris]